MVLKKTAIIAEKKAMEILGLEALDHKDRKIVQYVIRSLKGTGAKIANCEGVEPNPVITKALDDIEVVFGKEIADKTAARLAKVPFRPMNPIPHAFNINVQYTVDDGTHIVDENSGFVDHFKTPLQISEVDRVFIGHEFVHMNKELNYDEYKLGLKVNDVIPMLYEFIVMGEDSKEILNIRLTLLAMNIQEYEYASQKMRSSGKEKDLYKVIRDRNAQYLNSFYYATILYKMYKNDPKMILDYIRRVIRCEMTTLDMLKDLGIYLTDNNEMYDEQVQEFRGIVKK